MKKLDPKSRAARRLSEVLDARVAQWHRKAYNVDDPKKGAVEKSGFRLRVYQFIRLAIVVFLVLLYGYYVGSLAD